VPAQAHLVQPTATPTHDARDDHGGRLRRDQRTEPGDDHGDRDRGGNDRIGRYGGGDGSHDDHGGDD
jgi:hypothetical protein